MRSLAGRAAAAPVSRAPVPTAPAVLRKVRRVQELLVDMRGFPKGGCGKAHPWQRVGLAPTRQALFIPPPPALVNDYHPAVATFGGWPDNSPYGRSAPTPPV